MHHFAQSIGVNPNEILKQVTIEVNGVAVRFDYIYIKNGKVIFGEAKFSTLARDWANYFVNSITKNQKEVIDALKGGAKFKFKATTTDKIFYIGDRGMEVGKEYSKTVIDKLKVLGSGQDDVNVVNKIVDVFF